MFILCDSRTEINRTDDGIVPADVEPTGPTVADEAFRLATVPDWYYEGGYSEDDLSPWEQALELSETAWNRAIREMEEQEADRQYDRMIELWGPSGEAW